MSLPYSKVGGRATFAPMLHQLTDSTRLSVVGLMFDGFAQSARWSTCFGFVFWLNSIIGTHRLGAGWLVGGSSNVGCAVLRQQKFSAEEIEELSKDIDPATSPPSGIRWVFIVGIRWVFIVHNVENKNVLCRRYNCFSSQLCLVPLSVE